MGKKEEARGEKERGKRRATHGLWRFELFPLGEFKTILNREVGATGHTPASEMWASLDFFDFVPLLR